MSRISGLAEAAIYVKNLTRAADFYAHILGLPQTAVFDDVIFLQTGPNATLILFDIDTFENRVSIIAGQLVLMDIWLANIICL